MRARAPGRASESATFTTIIGRARRCAAAAAVLLLTVPLAGVAGGPDQTGAVAVPAAAVVPVASDDRAELAALRRQQQRASRDRRQAEQAAAQAATRAAAVAQAERQAVKKTTRPAARPAARTAPKQRARRPAGTTPAPPADGSRASAVVAFALAQVGKPYIWASTGPNGFDCSGLVMAAMSRVGVRLPTHKADDIGRRGAPVPRSQWQPGDVLHWQGHVGIYIGGGKVVHAPGRGRKITIASVWDSPSGRRLL